MARAIRLTSLATGADDATAEAALKACRYRVKTAIVMILLHVDAPTAQQRLADNDGDVRAALARVAQVRELPGIDDALAVMDPRPCAAAPS